MKHTFIRALLVCYLLVTASAQNPGDGYVNFIRQVQLAEGGIGTVWNMQVPPDGQVFSPLAINPYGARFEVHTVLEDSLVGFLLDSKYVASYIPVAEVMIYSEDPHNIIPRTRADRPFNVQITTNGLRNGVDDPEPSKAVKILHHVQAYGAGSDGTGINRTQATLLNQGFINSNGEQTLTYAITQVSGADRAKVRGEERFSVFSIADYQAPESQLDAQFIQIWPVADGTISGITTGETIRFAAPAVTFAVNDVYPEARVYAQIYEGNSALGTEGYIIPGSARIYNESIPQTYLEVVEGWDRVITGDGIWTMELLTSTPFGIDRLAHVTFNVDRTITVNGTVTTIE